MSVLIRRAQPSDLAYVTSRGWRDREAVGFLPRAAYERALAHAPELWIADADGDAVGFLLLSAGRPGGALHLTQVYVQADARRVEFGRALVARAEAEAQRRQRAGLACRVAADLTDARAFWTALGFPVVGVTPGGARRGRLIEQRYRPVSGGLFNADALPNGPAGRR